MATRQGYLSKRNAAGPNGSAMLRVYCVLAGATIWDFDSEEDAESGIRPRCEVEIIGVSSWSGKGRYATGFLFLSSMGTTFQAAAQNEHDLQGWLSAMQVGLHAKFGHGLLPRTRVPSDETSSPLPSPSTCEQTSRTSTSHHLPSQPIEVPKRRDADVCGFSGQSLSRSSIKCSCVSCGGTFAIEYCCEDIPLPQHNQEQGMRVCRHCLMAQYFLNHLKQLNAMLRTYLYEVEQQGRQVVDKSSAKTRVFRAQSKEALLAYRLYDSNQIDAKEFNELLLADTRLKDEKVNGLLAEFQQYIDKKVGEDAIMLLKHLFDLRDNGQPLKVAKLLQKLLDMAEHKLPAVDFVLPQLLQIFILMIDRGLDQTLQVEALEEFIIQICRKSRTQVPLRVIWAMVGFYEDTLQPGAPSSLMARRGRIIRLTLHVEAAMRGPVADINPEILSIFTIPSPAQLNLIQREWALLQECRRHALLRPFPPMTVFRKMHGSLDDDDLDDSVTSPWPSKEKSAGAVSGPTGGGFTQPQTPVRRERSSSCVRVARQMRFVKELTDIAENLRGIDMSLRREYLRSALQKIQSNSSEPVYFPICANNQLMPRITRICVDEGAVFRSKARVPVLACFEVLRNTYASAGMPRRRTASQTYMTESEVEEMIDKTALHERMSSLESPVTELMKSELRDQTNGVGDTRGNSEITRTGSVALYEPQKRQTVLRALPARSRGSSVSKATQGERGKAMYINWAEVTSMIRTRNRRATGAWRASLVSAAEDEMGWGRSDSLQTKMVKTPTADCLAEEGSGVVPLSGPAAEEIDLAKLLESYRRQPDGKELQWVLRSVSPAVATALQEFKKGNLSEEELRVLIDNDQKFRQNIKENSYLDAQFFVSLAFGESWAAKRSRIKAVSANGDREGWDLLSLIVKSNDDLRQEVCTMQLIELCQDIFLDAGLDLWLQPYGILSTSSSTGLIETLTDALSLDALKKNEGYVHLAHHFEISYGHDEIRLNEAKLAFVRSLAAYSLVCYVFQIKDRHNGNLLLDTVGHIIHIDYGFMLGIAPGGSFSIETAPFKLTQEMVDVMGGINAPLFDYFMTLFACGFFALQANLARIVSLVQIMAEQSRYPCFAGVDKNVIVQRLHARLSPVRSTPHNKAETVTFALDLISQSFNSLSTRQYDIFQNMSNGICI